MTTGVSRVKRFAVTIDGIDHSFADPLLKGRPRGFGHHALATSWDCAGT